MKLVITGALGKFFDVIAMATESLVPFVNDVLEFLTLPIKTALLSISDVPLLDFVAGLIADLIELVFGENVSILTACLGSAITVFIILHIIAFFNKVIGRE